MTYKDFLEESKRIFALNADIEEPSEEKIAKLYELTEIMLEVNKSLNLTAITDCSQIILKHYVDSLSVSKYIPENARVIDIGCGAGFPSLPLAICRDDVSITAIDSTAKRINYVSSTAQKLGLTNLCAITARAEEFANDQNHREKFDVSIARAVADLPILSELCLPFVKIGGSFIAMKAAKGDEEFAKAQNAMALCGGANAQIIRSDLTSDGSNYEKRRIIIAKKENNTPKNYPRNFSQISKKPL